MTKIINHDECVTDKQLADELSDIMDKCLESKEYCSFLDQSTIDMKLARSHYTKDPAAPFKPRKWSAEEFLRTELTICEFIISLNFQLCGQVQVAILDLQECLWQHFRRGDSNSKFGYDCYSRKVRRSRRAWQKALKNAVSHINHIVKKNNPNFSDDEIDALCIEKDKLIALYFNKPSVYYQSIKAMYEK